MGYPHLKLSLVAWACVSVYSNNCRMLYVPLNCKVRCGLESEMRCGLESEMTCGLESENS